MKHLLTALFAALWLLDTAATVSFVQQYGVDAEANPLMRQLMIYAGLQGFVLVKAAVLALWLSICRHASVYLHWFLVLVMTPIVYMGLQVAWG